MARRRVRRVRRTVRRRRAGHAGGAATGGARGPRSRPTSRWVPGGLIGELEALVEGLPLRERLWVHLMTALYRSGRQADALRPISGRGRRWWRSSASSRAASSGRARPGARPRPAAARANRSGGRALPGRRRRADVRRPRPRARSAPRRLPPRRRGRRRAGPRPGPSGIGKTQLLAELARHVQATGGTVTDRPTRVDVADRDARAAPARRRAEDVGGAAADVSEVLRLRRSRVLVVAPGLRRPLAGAGGLLADTFPDRLPLPPLSPAEVAALVELYVPQPDLAEAIASDGVLGGRLPRQVHAAAGPYGEALVAARIGAAALTISDPRRDWPAPGPGRGRGHRAAAAGVAPAGARRPGRSRHVCPYKGSRSTTSTTRPISRDASGSSPGWSPGWWTRRSLAVVGASGSGKSSVVRAGLLAAISAGLLPGSERWHVLLTTPPARRRPRPRPTSRPGRCWWWTSSRSCSPSCPRLRSRGTPRGSRPPRSGADVTVVVAVRSDYVAHGSPSTVGSPS